MIPGRVSRTRGGRQQRAFSLVELLVAMALALLITGTAIAMFTTSGQLQQEQERLALMKERLRFAVDFMARDIRAAGLRDNGDLDLAGGLERINDGSVEQQGFIVRKVGMNCLGDVGPWVASAYTVHGKQLRCANESTPVQNQPLVSDVRSMTVVALDAAGQPNWQQAVALRIELVLESTVRNQTLTHTLEFVVSLRNAVLAEYHTL